MEKVAATSERSTPAPLGGGAVELTLRRAAAAPCPLILTGETGTGKGYVARWIHEQSSRADGPFVPVNCGAIPDSLVDSHLFGHARGAFSGATHDHLGLVRAASNGTILFDEISELPLAAQTRLLRLLEEREVQPVGYSKPVVVNVRVIAAANVDLQHAVRAGRFREDLYFRLHVLEIPLQPLRNRLSEIPHLLQTFNAEFAEAYRQPPLRFSDEAMAHLARYHWPGNVRELRTVVERLHVLRGPVASPVSAEELARLGQVAVRGNDVSAWHGDRLPSLRRNAIDEALTVCRGNVSRAAVRLGVHRSTIYRWLERQPVTAA